MTTNETRKTSLELKEDLARFRTESDRVIRLTAESGLEIDMAHWLTIKRYAERYGLTTQVVSNWISRGTIPPECTMIVPELNDLRLVRDQPYK